MKRHHSLRVCSSTSVSRQSTGCWNRQSGEKASPFFVAVCAIAGLEVDRVAVDGHRGLHDGLAQSRVGMDVAAELPGVALEQLRERGLGDELRGVLAHDVRAQQPPCLRVRDHLYEAGRLAVDDRAAESAE